MHTSKSMMVVVCFDNSRNGAAAASARCQVDGSSLESLLLLTIITHPQAEQSVNMCLCKVETKGPCVHAAFCIKDGVQTV